MTRPGWLAIMMAAAMCIGPACAQDGSDDLPVEPPEATTTAGAGGVLDEGGGSSTTEDDDEEVEDGTGGGGDDSGGSEGETAGMTDSEADQVIEMAGGGVAPAGAAPAAGAASQAPPEMTTPRQRYLHFRHGLANGPLRVSSQVGIYEGAEPGTVLTQNVDNLFELARDGAHQFTMNEGAWQLDPRQRAEYFAQYQQYLLDIHQHLNQARSTMTAAMAAGRTEYSPATPATDATLDRPGQPAQRARTYAETIAEARRLQQQVSSRIAEARANQNRWEGYSPSTITSTSPPAPTAGELISAVGSVLASRGAGGIPQPGKLPALIQPRTFPQPGVATGP